MICFLRAFLPALVFCLPALASLSTPPARAAQEGDTTNITVTGSLVEGGDCTINNGSTVNVNFGDDVYIGQINGTSYKKTEIPLNISCADAISGSALTLSFIAAGTGTGCDTLLCTDRNGLGLRLYHGDSALDVGSKVPFVVVNGATYDLSTVYAVPVLTGTPSAGAFNSLATVIIGVQ